MKIGSDVSLHVCRAEGYLIMEYTKNKLFKKGILQKDVYVRFTATSGYLAWNDNGKLLPPQLRKADAYILNVGLCWDDLIEIYEYNKKGIDSLCDYEHCKPNFDSPSEYDMLNLASDIHSYCGLDT